MSKSQNRYSEDEKLSLLREYHQSGMSKNAFAKRHGLSCTRLLNKWLKKYGIEKEMLPLQPEPDEEDMANRSKESYKEEVAQLKKRNKELEKALEFSRLETLARDIMIDKAEEYFDISIRKKSGAKQP
jgi:transposase-like protein